MDAPNYEFKSQADALNHAVGLLQSIADTIYGMGLANADLDLREWREQIDRAVDQLTPFIRQT